MPPGTGLSIQITCQDTFMPKAESDTIEVLVVTLGNVLLHYHGHEIN
jgi:hypothetical protein